MRKIEKEGMEELRKTGMDELRTTQTLDRNGGTKETNGEGCPRSCLAQHPLLHLTPLTEEQIVIIERLEPKPQV